MKTLFPICIVATLSLVILPLSAQDNPARLSVENDSGRTVRVRCIDARTGGFENEYNERISHGKIASHNNMTPGWRVVGAWDLDGSSCSAAAIYLPGGKSLAIQVLRDSDGKLFIPPIGGAPR